MARQMSTILAVVLIALLLTPVIAVAQAGTANYYSVYFHETGLPNGTQWSASVNGSTELSNNSSITFMEPNGSYDFSFGGVANYRPLPNHFNVTVRGSNVSLVVVWVPVFYNVTFLETGLPSNTYWNVTLGNETSTSTNSTINFRVMNGTYTYSIPEVNGIASLTPNGTIRVSGESTRVFVTFTFPVNFTFIESGLPSGSKWSVWISGNYYNSTSSIIYVTLPNASYNFLVRLPSGYTASPSSGKINYSNDLIVIKATSFLPYEIVIAILVILIGILLGLYVRAKRRGKQNVEPDREHEEEK